MFQRQLDFHLLQAFPANARPDQYVSAFLTLYQVFSWSRSKAAYDTGASDGSNPRAYMSVLSEVTHASDTCDGAADDDVGEGRLDSEIPLAVPLALGDRKLARFMSGIVKIQQSS